MQAKAAQKEIEEFTLDFKNAARKCFELIDKDGGGTLDKGEIVRAVKEDQEVISFLKTCGEENLMFLLHPPRLEKALAVLDTDNSGEVDVDEWETAINRGLAKRLEQMAKERERRERAAAAADEEFSAEFLTAARKVRSSVQSSPVPARAFVLLLVLQVDWKLSILGALGFGFSTYFYSSTHNAKFVGEWNQGQKNGFAIQGLTGPPG